MKKKTKSVWSILTFGCETWNLNRETIKTMNDVNNRRFTGLTIPQEARPTSTSFNLIHKIRQRRLRWVGHILRAACWTQQDHLPLPKCTTKDESWRTLADGRSPFQLSARPRGNKSDGQGRMVRTYQLDSSLLLTTSRIGTQIECQQIF